MSFHYHIKETDRQHLQLRLANIVNLRLARRLSVLALRISARVADWPAYNIRLRLLIDHQALSLSQRIEGLLLDAVHQVVARGDVVDQADDLASCPDLIKKAKLAIASTRARRDDRDVLHNPYRHSKTPLAPSCPKRTARPPRTSPSCSPSPP